MFEPSTEPGTGPRVFAVPPGADFPTVLAAGLRARMQGQPQEAMARVEVIVNTARMRTRLRDALIAQGPGFLPRIRLIADLAGDEPTDPPLRIRLALAQAIRALLQQEPDLGPPGAAFSLADSLYRLLDEMQGEGVSLTVLDTLDVSEHSEHWARSLRFIRLIGSHFGPVAGGQARLRRQIAALADSWHAAPPDHPVIVAGSTGSRGPGRMLMRAVARLPQGALVLPGFDSDSPANVWHGLEDPLTNEDHPQFRYARLLADLGFDPAQVRGWTDRPAPDPGRNRVFSLALRPAPVTDQWLREGQALGDLPAATARMALIEAPTPRLEALAIALRMRQAAVEGQSAALVTPDRALARRVTAVLDRWHLRPDDSAGRPLALSPPGRFLRQCAELMSGAVSAHALIALLKHPLAHSGGARGEHLRHVRDLELHLRRRMIPFPDSAALATWAERDPSRTEWAAWLAGALATVPDAGERPLADWVEDHLTMAQTLAGGTAGPESHSALWEEQPGQAARSVMQDLVEQAEHGGAIAVTEYASLLDSLFAGQEVREIVESHPGLMIWGTLEARAQGADLVILGGLNEGVWPAATQPDPWFNRAMRLQAGLLLPERRIGLSAHDFQQAVGAPQVVLTRATRDAEAETVPSRWVNRVLNLIGGLPAQSGPDALNAMRARGQHWLEQATGLEADLSDVPQASCRRNPRPAPAPPLSVRPKELPVTRFETLARDPYEIYAKDILRLRERDALAPQPDARMRGTALHKVVEAYVDAHPPGTPGSVAGFMQMAEHVLAQECPWLAVRTHWLARLNRVAGAFVAWNASLDGTPVLAEEKGRMSVPEAGFTLTGMPDRIDRASDGSLRLYDYKTGALPSEKQQEHFNRQLILLALMAENGAFRGLDPAPVSGAAYIGMGSKFETRLAPVDPETLTRHRAELIRLIRAYQSPDQGYTAMRRVKDEARIGPYHPLARRGEWQPTDPAETIPVGDPDG